MVTHKINEQVAKIQDLTLVLLYDAINILRNGQIAFTYQ
jgi:hypothetical protein